MQKNQKKYKNLFISLAVTCVLVIMNFLLFYPDNSGLGKGFSVAILYILVRYVILYTGVIVLFARLVRKLKKKDSILYILPGAVNVIIGILGVILYFLGHADMPWLHKCLMNLLVGTLIITDAFILKE